MNKVKSLIALCIVVTIVAACALSASAALSSRTYVYWNANETAAWAETIADGPSIADFYATARIKSMSTQEERYAYASSGGTSTSVTATTTPVSITYPSPIPLVEYSGSHGFVN